MKSARKNNNLEKNSYNLLYFRYSAKLFFIVLFYYSSANYFPFPAPPSPALSPTVSPLFVVPVHKSFTALSLITTL